MAIAPFFELFAVHHVSYVYTGDWVRRNCVFAKPLSNFPRTNYLSRRSWRGWEYQMPYCNIGLWIVMWRSNQQESTRFQSDLPCLPTATLPFHTIVGQTTESVAHRTGMWLTTNPSSSFMKCASKFFLADISTRDKLGRNSSLEFMHGWLERAFVQLGKEVGRMTPQLPRSPRFYSAYERYKYSLENCKNSAEFLRNFGLVP